MWKLDSTPGFPNAACELEAGKAACIAGRQPGFDWLMLPRHGKRPLAVKARTLLRADNRCSGMSLWSEIAIHETEGGRYAATLWHHLPVSAAWRDAWLCEDAATVRMAFLHHDPLWAMPIDLPARRHANKSVEDDGGGSVAFQLAWAGLLGAVFGRNLGPQVAQ